MSKVISPLSLIEFTVIQMSLTKRGWWDDIPAEPGWYAIETNTPLSVLKKLKTKRDIGKRYKLSNRITDATYLIDTNLIIAQDAPDRNYVVYSGEHADLKARAREHTHGSKGTGCLCLHLYPSIQKYNWRFLYRTCEIHVPGCGGNKGLRTLLEQHWRAINGWPVLCKQ